MYEVKEDIFLMLMMTFVVQMLIVETGKIILKRENNGCNKKALSLLGSAF